MVRSLVFLPLLALATSSVPKASRPSDEHRLIVRFAESEQGDADLMERRVQELGAREGVLRAKGFTKVAMAVAVLESPEAEERLLGELEADPTVELATPDTWVHFDGTSDDTGGRAAAMPWEPQLDVRSCSAQSRCAAQGLAGQCCPASDGAMLACCDGPASQHLVAFRSIHGKYIVAEEDGEINANSRKLESGETFQLISNSDGTVSLRTNFGRYVVAEPSGGITAHSPLIGERERFSLLQNADLTVALKTYSGKFFVAELDGALNASRDPFDDWEKFRMVSVSSPSRRLPDDASFSSLWGLHSAADHDIDAPEAWNTFTGEFSAGIVVAVIDTGIDYNHEDLRENMWVNPREIPDNGLDDDGNGYVDDVHGADFANEDGDPFDDQMHGTHCAGTIAGAGNNGLGVAGVSWRGVKLMALKFLSASGHGRSSDAVEAIDYAVAHGARIASNSWGSPGSSAAVRVAIERAETAGLLFIAAAGNSGTDNDLQPHYPSSYPVSNVISVASTTRDGPLSSFSCYGAESVDVAAPGSSIYSTVPGQGYKFLSGTSMATPHVTGLAALVWMYRPSLGMEQVREVLLTSVRQDPELGSKILTGGRINAKRALEAAAAFEPPRPPVHPPRHLAFADTDPRVGVIAGTVTITAAADESDVEYYRLYFVSQAGFQLHSLGTVAASGEPVLELQLNGSLAMPRYVAALVAVAGNSSGEMPAQLGGIAPNLTIDDLGLPLGLPQAADWEGDMDLRSGLVRGTLTVARSADESQTTRYNIYWANSSGVRGPLIGSLTAGDFHAPRCTGTGCSLIMNASDGLGHSRFERGAYGNNEKAVITISGPGRMTVTRCDTEHGFDFLTVGQTKISGQPDVPLEVEIPRGKAAVQWHSDSSITAGGWAFELRQAEAEVRFAIASRAPLGRGLEVVPAYGRHELPEGLFVHVTDFDIEMPPSPAYAPADLHFEDLDPAVGAVAGTAEVLPTPGAAESGSVSYYKLDFADAAGRPMGPGTTAAANGSSMVLIPLVGPVPVGAVQLLARAGNAFGLSARGELADLVDARPQEPPTGPEACVWACGGANSSEARWEGDLDMRSGFVQGTLAFPRAPNESRIVQYNVYWANASNLRGPRIGSLAAAGFRAPRCRGKSCPLIANASRGPGRTSFERGAYGSFERASLTASGPGLLTVTQFDTERNYDFLTIGETKLSGQPELPLEIQLPRGQVAISWHSDRSITATGWAFELHQDEAEARFQLVSTAPLGQGLVVVPVDSHHELPEALFVPVADFNAVMPPSPGLAPASLSFEDMNLADGEVAGVAELLPALGAAASGAVIYYQVDFADAVGRPIGVGVTAAASGSPLVRIPFAGTVPAGAVQLLARAGNAFGLGTRGVLVALVDDSLREVPRSAHWEGDRDSHPRLVQGTLTLARSADESQTTHYNVYWANASGVRGPLVGNLSVAGFQAPRCNGTSCPAIANVSRGPGRTLFERGAYENNERAIITASGPGLLMVTRFQTEGNYDYLRVADSRLSGKPDVPLEFHLPRGPAAVEWHSDISVTARGWVFELRQDESEAHFRLAATAPLGHGLEVVAARGQKELPAGLFVPIADVDRATLAVNGAVRAAPLDTRLSALSAALSGHKAHWRSAGSAAGYAQREPWLPPVATTRPEVVVWPSASMAAFSADPRAQRRILVSVAVPGLDARDASAGLAKVVPGVLAASLLHVEEGGIHVLRVLATAGAPAVGSALGEGRGGARVELELVPATGSPASACDRIEARVILLGKGGGAAERFSRALATGLAASGIVLPAGSRPVVGEPQQLWLRGHGRALAAAAEARRLAAEEREPEAAAGFAAVLGAAAAAAMAACAATLALASRRGHSRRAGAAAGRSPGLGLESIRARLAEGAHGALKPAEPV